MQQVWKSNTFKPLLSTLDSCISSLEVLILAKSPTKEGAPLDSFRDRSFPTVQRRWHLKPMKGSSTQLRDVNCCKDSLITPVRNVAAGCRTVAVQHKVTTSHSSPSTSSSFQTKHKQRKERNKSILLYPSTLPSHSKDLERNSGFDFFRFRQTTHRFWDDCSAGSARYQVPRIRHFPICLTPRVVQFSIIFKQIL